MVLWDRVLHASLSRALEKLSVSELSVIDTMASLHMLPRLNESASNINNSLEHVDHNYCTALQPDGITHQEQTVKCDVINTASLSHNLSPYPSEEDQNMSDNCVIDNFANDMLLNTVSYLEKSCNLRSIDVDPLDMERSASTDEVGPTIASVNVALGTNTVDLTSSSEFEGFTKEDLEPPHVMGAIQSCVLGTNKENLDPDLTSVTGTNTNQSCVLAINTNRVDISLQPIDITNDVTGNDHTEKTEKENEGSLASSSSSEFDRFTEEDLKPLPPLKYISDSESSISLSDPTDQSEPEDKEGDTTQYLSDETILYQMTHPPDKIIVKGSKTPTPILFVEKLEK